MLKKTQFGSRTKKPALAHKDNLNTILRAAREEALALVECRWRATGERVAVLSAIGRDGQEHTITPFAVLINGNPYKFLDPPLPGGGFANPK